MLRKNKVFNLDYLTKFEDSNIKNKNKFSSTENLNVSENSSLLVGQGVTINGSIKAKNEVIIEGKVEADVEAKSIHIGKTGEVVGSVKANLFKVEGKAKGEIEVESIIKILSSGSIDGKISYKKLEVQEGGSIKGEINTLDGDVKKTDNLEAL